MLDGGALAPLLGGVEAQSGLEAGGKPGANRVNIYDTPLKVLAALLAVGFVLTLLVRPLKREQYQAV